VTATVVAVVSITPSANADSSSDQTLDKFNKKCKAVEKGSQKKADQEAQAERHGTVSAFCGIS
jgi:hypothetical protein